MTLPALVMPAMFASVGFVDRTMINENIQRHDGQSLRSIALLLALTHHAKARAFQEKHLGDDIALTISGFLITNLVVRAVRCGTFGLLSRWRSPLAAQFTRFVISVVGPQCAE